VVKKFQIQRRAIAMLACSTFFLSACGPGPNYHLDVKVLTTIGQGVGDLAFVDEVVKGVALARLQADFFIDFYEPLTAAEAEAQFEYWLNVQQSHDDVLIITVGAGHVQLVESKQCDFNDRYVLHLDQNLAECPRLRTATFRTFAPSFLAGVAAVEMSPRKRAAAIGGMQLPAVDEFIYGFKAGVEYAGGELTTIEYLAEDFSGFNDPEKAKAAALRLYQEADVIIPVAGGSAIGVIEAAKEFLDPDPRYAIGVDTDQSFHGINVVIGSVTKNLKKVTADTIIDSCELVFEAETINIGMLEEGSDFLMSPVFENSFSEVVNAARLAAQAAEDNYYESLP
jgi:basic membrane protein A and related proteins